MSETHALDKAGRTRGLWTVAATLVRAVSWLATIGVLLFITFQYTSKGTSEEANAASEPPLPAKPLAIGEWKMGRTDAPVAVAAYMDFQCPYCQRFYQQTLPVIRKKYIDTGHVLLAFRQMPSRGHPAAMPAALAAACAGQQGHFWEMADRLYGGTELDVGVFQRYARDIGLKGDRFDSCTTGRWAQDEVAADQVSAAAAHARGTPYFVVGVQRNHEIVATKVIIGAKQPSEFTIAFDNALAAPK